METSRECLSCHRVLPLEDFYKQKAGLYGRMAICKACRYDKYERPFTHIKVCKVCGKREVHRRPKWCLRCDAAKAKQWRTHNRARFKAMMKAWRKSHPEVGRKHRALRVAWLRSGDVTRSDLEQIWEACSGRCYYCTAEVFKPRFNPTDPRGFDHVIPRSKGGKHTPENIVVCCWGCNSWKSGDDPDVIKRRATLCRMPAKRVR